MNYVNSQGQRFFITVQTYRGKYHGRVLNRPNGTLISMTLTGYDTKAEAQEAAVDLCNYWLC